jgi:hypothetical protein
MPKLLPASATALYLPALSQNFATFVHAGSFRRSLPITAQQLDFLAPKPTVHLPGGMKVTDPKGPLFHYPYALYSAGQAAKTDAMAAQESIVSQRDRNATFVVGDSGGFQIETGTIKFRGDATRERMLRWMERHANYCMALDFPTGGISGGGMESHIQRLLSEGHDLHAMADANGLGLGFNACLIQTKLNNDYFLANARPETAFLNVQQGRNESESRYWFDAVKHYPFAAWAFAGAHHGDLGLMLRRLVQMRDEGILGRVRWLHILGVSTLPLACLFTTAQQCVRREGDPAFQISFDSASPSKLASSFQIATGCTLDAHGWAIHASPLAAEARAGDRTLLNDFCGRHLPDERHASGRRRRHGAATQIGARVAIGDVCVPKEDGEMRVDTDGMYMLMHHNIEAFLQAFRRAHHAYEDPDPKAKPTNITVMRAMIETIFKQRNPGPLIDECAEMLARFASR